jgi:hypothetical protein
VMAEGSGRLRAIQVQSVPAEESVTLRAVAESEQIHKT